MSDKNTKRYMELQMEELKETYGIEKEKKADPKNTSGREEDAEIAGLYEDAWEYEEELQVFEAELKVIKAGTLKNITASLSERFPDEERDYAQELKAVILTGWTHLVEGKGTHPKEQLALIEATELDGLSEKLSNVYPDNAVNFETELKGLLIQRWETYIQIKKEHIKEETDHIKTLGLKPHYAKKIYKRYHGIE